MENIKTENIFLLEFVVDKINLKENRRVRGCDSNTYLSVQFFDNPPLDISDTDFPVLPRKCKTPEPNVASGKSCMFALTPEQVFEALEEFDVNISIFKKRMTNDGTEKVQLGTSIISLVDTFTQLMATVNANADNPSPVDKSWKDNFEIGNASDEGIGDFGMYVRLSCLGKVIVSQFQMDCKDHSVTFKDKEGYALYKYKNAGMVCDVSCLDPPPPPSHPCNPANWDEPFDEPETGDSVPAKFVLNEPVPEQSGHHRSAACHSDCCKPRKPSQSQLGSRASAARESTERKSSARKSSDRKSTEDKSKTPEPAPPEAAASPEAAAPPAPPEAAAPPAPSEAAAPPAPPEAAAPPTPPEAVAPSEAFDPDKAKPDAPAPEVAENPDEDE